MAKTATKVKAQGDNARRKSWPLNPIVSVLRGVFLRSQKRVPAQAPTPPPIRFESLEQRVLMSADVNPSLLNVSGALQAPGQQNQYQFTVKDPTLVVLNSLTNRSDIDLTLTGPNGQVVSESLAQVNANWNTSPALELDAGTYTATISAQGDATGSYNLRAVDASQAVAFAPGTVVSGSLPDGNDIAVYSFSAQAGDQYWYVGGEYGSPNGTNSYGNTVDWRLIDPYGRQVTSPQSLGSSTSPFTVQSTGTYLLVVEGGVANSGEVDYNFKFQQVPVTTQALNLDQVQNVDISTPFQVDNYTFSVTSATQVLFDNLSNNFLWTLNGPQGTVVSNRYTTDTSVFYSGGQTLWLTPGNYTLSIQANGSQTGTGAFRLLSATSATTLSVDTAISGTLDQPTGSDLYQVALQAGQQVYVENSSSGGDLSWRLIDPFGNLVASTSSQANSQTSVTVAATGLYWLALDGNDFNDPTSPVTYQLRLNNTAPVLAPLTLGATTTGSIDKAGQAVIYSFSLASDTQLVFDSQTDNDQLTWTLSGPMGTMVFMEPMNRLDAILSRAPAGSYTLTVQDANGATGAYAFSLIDAATASQLSLGATVDDTLATDSVRAYQFTANPGDILQLTASYQGGSPVAQIYDAFGNRIFSDGLGDDFSSITLSAGGQYTFIVASGFDNGPANYNFSLSVVGNNPQAGIPVGASLSLSSIASGQLTSAGSTVVYNFTLQKASVIFIDAQTDTGLTWTLQGPEGTSTGYLYNLPDTAPLYLAAGNYAFTITNSDGGANEAYAFRLLNASDFTQLTLDQTTFAARSPASSIVGYQFTATAGQTFQLYDQQDDTEWLMVDAFGRTVPPSGGYRAYYDNTSGLVYTFKPSSAGTYYLINEGYAYQSSYPNSNLAFRLAAETVNTEALSLNQATAGTLNGSWDEDVYTLTVQQPSTFIFNPMGQLQGGSYPYTSQPLWTLSGNNGVVSYQSLYGINVYTLRPGQYQLTVSPGWYSSGQSQYSFSMLDAHAAATVVPGTAQTISVSGASVSLLGVQAQAGTSYLLQDTGSDYGMGVVVLDPYGNVAWSGNSVYENGASFSATVDGEYLIAVYNSYTGSARTFSVNVIQSSSTNLGLTLGAATSGMLEAGQSAVYGFELDAPTTILMDASDADGGMVWSLSGPRGSEASQRSFGQNTVFELPAGYYQLTVSGLGLSSGSYSFTASDLSQSTKLVLNQYSTVSLSPTGDTQAFQVTVSGDSQYFVDLGDWRSAGSQWQLFSPSGVMLQAGNGGGLYPDADFSLAGGTYYLVVLEAGLNGPATFNLALRSIQQVVAPLALNTDVSGQFAAEGQKVAYQFTLGTASYVLLDSALLNSDLQWQISSASGYVLYSGDLAGDSTPVALQSGSYILTVFARSNAAIPYAFKLLNLSDAQQLVLGQSQTLTFNQDSAQVFVVDGQVGSYFRYTADNSDSNNRDFTISMMDPSGNYLFSDYAADSDQLTAFTSTGPHLLIVQANWDYPVPSQVAFTAQVIQPRVTPLTLGSVETGNLINEQGIEISDSWTFSLDTPQRLVLMPLQVAGASWSLTGPAGRPVASGSDDEPSILVLAAGSYSLSYSASGGSGGGYAFELLDASSATALTQGNPISNTVAAGSGAQVYSLAVSDISSLLSLQAQSTNGEGGTITILSPQGEVLATSDLPLFTPSLPETGVGTYLVVVAGTYGDTSPLTYTLEMQPTPPPTPAALGDTLTGTLSPDAPSQTYLLNVLANSNLGILLNASGLGNTQWQWTPVGGTGGGWSSDSAGPAVIDAGQYYLTVEETSDAGGTYRLQLLNFDTAAPLGSGVSSTLQAGTDAAAYQLSFTQPSQLNLGFGSTDPTQLAWSLYDAENNLVALSGSATPANVAVDSGLYTLMVAGLGDPSQPIDYTIEASTSPQVMLSPGAIVQGTTGGGNLPRTYYVNVSYQMFVQMHDIGSDAGVHWTFDEINGTSSSYSGVTGETSSDGGDPEASYPNTFSVNPGIYRWTVYGAGPDSNFDLQLVDLSDAPVLPVGGVNGTITQSQGTAAYTVDFTSPQAYQISLNASGGDASASISWALYRLDTYNYTLVSQGVSNGSVVQTPLLQPDDYTLLLKGQNAAGLGYALSVQPVGPQGSLPSIALGDSVSGTLSAQAGQPYAVVPLPQDSQDSDPQSISYQLTVSATTLLMVNDAGSSGDLRWNLDSVDGSNSYWDNVGQNIDSYLVGPGDYIFTPPGEGHTLHARDTVVIHVNLPQPVMITE